MIRKILTILLPVLFFPAVGTSTKVYETRAFDNDIRSIRIWNESRNPLLPVIELGSPDKITLSFDDLSETLNTYSYKIIHCNWDWTPSDLSESQYIDGYTGGYLEHESSVGTYFPYNHFTLEFPNDEAECTVSGNYVIVVYPDNNDDNPVLTACFSVVEHLVQTECGVSSQTDIDYRKEHQQVSLVINYPDYDLSQPQNTLRVVVQQNRRRDNQAVLASPSFYQNNRIDYKMNPALIFKAGNQYQSFDISSERILDREIESIDYYKPYYHATLYPDVPRRERHVYSSDKDLNGRYIINLQGSDYPDTDGDYFFTHFTLETEPYLDKEVHILGDITGNRISDDSKMRYNFERNCYEKTLLLKQGGYNYIFAAVPMGSNTADVGEIEGNFWETQNEYTIYVYYHPFGSLYDRLIGYDIVYSNDNY